MLLTDHFLWDGERPYITRIKNEYARSQQEVLPPPTVVTPDDGTEYFEAPPVFSNEEISPQQELNTSKLSQDEPKERKTYTGNPKIALVIDDVGMNLKQSNIAIHELPPEVTLAFLPYAEKVEDLSKQAREKGHEILIHAPMEALDSNRDLGPMALREHMDFATFDKEFEKMANSFEGYIGVNNHMGSRLTQNPEAMGYLMDQLKKRDLFFLDSRTIHLSVAGDIAESYGVPYTERDIFIDHHDRQSFVAKALRMLERKARHDGTAVAIGHPKDGTMKTLKRWIPTLEDKGIELVPLSELIKYPEEKVVKEKDTVSPASGP